LDRPPARQYIRILNLCRELGATVIANTVVSLTDDTLVNFVYRVDGLRSFAVEYKCARELEWLGLSVRVLPIERVYASKKFISRPKDIAHLPLLEGSHAPGPACPQPQLR
jgi:hypothetical protein